MGIDPRIEQIREALKRNPNLGRTHFAHNWGIGYKTILRWINEGLLEIPERPRYRPKLTLRGSRQNAANQKI